jgi:hypothetical protein
MSNVHFMCETDWDRRMAIVREKAGDSVEGAGTAPFVAAHDRGACCFCSTVDVPVAIVSVQPHFGACQHDEDTPQLDLRDFATAVVTAYQLWDVEGYAPGDLAVPEDLDEAVAALEDFLA